MILLPSALCQLIVNVLLLLMGIRGLEVAIFIRVLLVHPENFQFHI